MSKKVRSVKKSISNVVTTVTEEAVTSPKREFFVAAMNMSWQLAVVVLVPLVGGFKIDERYSSLPVATLIGFGIAMIGMTMIVFRQIQLYSPKIVTASKSEVSKK